MREDTTSRTESAAADHARLLGASEHIGGGAEHEFTLQPGPGRKDYVAACSCGWRSQTLRLVWVKDAHQRHVKEVGPDV